MLTIRPCVRWLFFFKFHTRQSYHFLLFFTSSYPSPQHIPSLKEPAHRFFSTPNLFNIQPSINISMGTQLPGFILWSYHLQIFTPTLISATCMTIPQILSSSCFTSVIWNTCTISLTISISMQVSLHLFFVHKKTLAAPTFHPLFI